MIVQKSVCHRRGASVQMEYSQFYEEYGQPFSGKKAETLAGIFESMQLSYDQGVEYTVNLVDAQGEIAATGSRQQNVIKCVAVDDRHQGRRTFSRVVTLLMNHAIEQGNSHLFVFTKPKNIAMFSDLLDFSPLSRQRTCCSWKMCGTASADMSAACSTKRTTAA